jgi:hypothetical protein
MGADLHRCDGLHRAGGYHPASDGTCGHPCAVHLHVGCRVERPHGRSHKDCPAEHHCEPFRTGHTITPSPVRRRLRSARMCCLDDAEESAMQPARRRRHHTVTRRGPTTGVSALRTAVQWRKIMFGNRSADGELAVARLLTVTRTCRLQQLNALVYLTGAIRCHRRRQAVASLLAKPLTH